MAGKAAARTDSKGERTADQWQQLGTGTTGLPVRKKTLQFDVAVIGGGLAGVCAAVAAARNGAKTVLIQDRPVLGGNASSEIRVNANGVSHPKPTWLPKRETGIIEEILIENRFANPQESYSVWDHVIYDFASREPNLDVMMNTQATEAVTEGRTIRSAICWQSTTETELAIHAQMFIDCSGDGLLAATAGALYRTGREAASEFNEQFAPERVGSVPGRRESRRFIGDHVLSERDLVEHRHFPDAVAYGGWSLDEHCPGGIENPNDPPSFFHYRFSKVYEIPFRSLYSRNISNLLLAGRNVSQTHIALSSTRVMATSALMGQAAGTGAALCVRKGVDPRELAHQHVNELQEQLLRDDAYIPNRPAKDPKDLARQAGVIFAHPTRSGDARLLTDGVSRDEEGTIHHRQSDSLPAELQLEWERLVSLSRREIKCDTNLQCNIMMRKTAPKSHHTTEVPPELLKSLTAEARVDGKWVQIGSIDQNRTRLIKMDFETVKTTAVRVRLRETYGHPTAKLFEVRCYEAP
jgi:hypothetical protein